MYKILRKRKPVSNFRLNRFLIRGTVLISKFALEPEKFPGFSRNGRLICPNGNGDSKLKQVILGPAPGVRGWGGGASGNS